MIIRVVPTLLGCGDPMTEYIGNVLYLSFTLCVLYVFSLPGAAKNCFNIVSGDGVEDSDGSGGDGGVEVVMVLEVEVVGASGGGGGRRGDGDRGGDDHDGV